MAEQVPVASPERKRQPKERGIDDYKRKIWKLKKELEEQREMALVLQKEELQKQAQVLQSERELALDALKRETRDDLLQMKAAFSERETELSRTVKRQEEETKMLKKQLSAHEEEVKGVKDAIESAHQDSVSRLQKEVRQLKQINQDLQQKYQVKQQDYRDKVAELKAVQDEATQERQKLLSDALTAKLNRVKKDQDSPGSGAKDRDLQQKVTELTVALKRVEKRCDALKEENNNLRKGEVSSRELEEQCAKLKRRNAELANSVKLAGEKNKQLQVTSKRTESTENASSLEHAKKLFARQRAKDFAEHAKTLLNKDKEIEKLTKKNLIVSENISNQRRSVNINHQLDMSTALRQGTKERMALEMKSTGPAGDDVESRATIFNMQVDYDTLKDKYDSLLGEKLKLEQEMEEFRGRLGEVEQELGKTRKEKTTLQEEMEVKDRKCVQLTAINNNVTKERDHLNDTVDKLSEEVAVLKHENKSCQRTIDKLTDSNKELKKALEVKDNESLQRLETNIVTLTDQLEQTKSHLREKMVEVTELREETNVSSERITELLDKNQDLKAKLNEVNHVVMPSIVEQSDELKVAVKRLELKNEDLKEERDELAARVDEQEDVASRHESLRLENLTLCEELNEVKELLAKGKKLSSEQSTQLETLSSQLQQANEERLELENNRLEAQRRIEGLKTDFRSILITKDEEINDLKSCNADLTSNVSECAVKYERVNAELEDANEQIRALQADLSRELSTHNTELESMDILSNRLNEAAKQLEETQLAKTQLQQSLDGLQTANQSNRNELELLSQSKAELEQKFGELREEHEQVVRVVDEQKIELSAVHEAEENLSVLGGENEALGEEVAELKKLVAEKETENSSIAKQMVKLAHDLESLQSIHLETSNAANSKQTQLEAVKLELTQLQDRQAQLECSLEKSKHNFSEAKKQENLAKKKLVAMKQEITHSFEEKIGKLNKTLDVSQQTNKDLQEQLMAVTAELEEQSMKQISVYAGENCYHLYVARHVYDPSLNNDSNDSQSPSPSKSVDRSGADSALSATEKIADIAVNPGDYVFVSGGLSEEGFYEGHLLDGRAGFIPSNVLEPLYEFDIYGFVIASESADDGDESHGAVSEFSSTMFNDSNILPSTPRPLAPHPRNLRLERQFSNGIMVGWDCPEGQDPVFVYKVYVDNKFKVSLNGRSKCSAMIEGVKSSLPHRVCVTATTRSGESDRRHATMMIGEPNKPPTELHVVATSSDSAHISFLPHNSNHHHFVSVNGEKVRTLAPSCFQVDIAGLLPLTEYSIAVTASQLPLDHSLTSNNGNKKPLQVDVQFTMPSVEEISEHSESNESAFLQRFDEFLDVVTNGSPTPAISYVQQIEPELEDADFLKSYDATLANIHPNVNSPSNSISHSTPKYPVKVKEKLEQDFSPIILDLDSHDVNDVPKRRVSGNDRSNSESTITVGMSDQLTTNGTKTAIDFEESRVEGSRKGKHSTESNDNGSGVDHVSPGRSHTSPLQNKHSLQKMIKSLANKEKGRGSKPHPQDKVSKTELDSTHHTSARHRSKSDEKRGRHSKHAAEQSAVTTSHAVSKDTRVRYFKALYVYNPAVMSPNKDAINDELAFQEDDIITIFGDVDDDGFYLGQLQGKQGYVPSNLIKEMQLEALAAGERRMRVLYDFCPSSRHSGLELSLHADDIVIVAGSMDEDGFYKGHISGRKAETGLIPSKYVQPWP